MAISFSRPDPSSPTAVAGATFPSSRRGFDQNEVRDFLRMVSAEISRQQERITFLERELLNSQQAGSAPQIELNEETITELLGEETARIVQAAREAAGKIKVRSEETATRLVREATDEAARVREDAELEAGTAGIDDKNFQTDGSRARIVAALSHTISHTIVSILIRFKVGLPSSRARFLSTVKIACQSFNPSGSTSTCAMVHTPASSSWVT